MHCESKRTVVLQVFIAGNGEEGARELGQRCQENGMKMGMTCWTGNGWEWE